MRPIVRINVRGTQVSFPAWIDLGFEGDLVLPNSSAIRFGVVFTGRMMEVLRGDGTLTSMPLGRLPIRFLGRNRTARVLLAGDREAARDEASGELLALIGLGLLRDVRLRVDLVPQGTVVVERPIPTA